MACLARASGLAAMRRMPPTCVSPKQIVSAVRVMAAYKCTPDVGIVTKSEDQGRPYQRQMKRIGNATLHCTTNARRKLLIRAKESPAARSAFNLGRVNSWTIRGTVKTAMRYVVSILFGITYP